MWEYFELVIDTFFLLLIAGSSINLLTGSNEIRQFIILCLGYSTTITAIILRILLCCWIIREKYDTPARIALEKMTVILIAIGAFLSIVGLHVSPH